MVTESLVLEGQTIATKNDSKADRHSFDLPYDIILDIALYLDLYDLKSFRLVNRYLATSIGESVHFRYLAQPSCQAALACALAKDDERLWDYALNFVDESVKFEELAAFYFVRPSTLTVWNERFHKDVLPRLTNLDDNSWLLAYCDLLNERNLTVGIPSFNPSTLPHNIEKRLEKKEELNEPEQRTTFDRSCFLLDSISLDQFNEDTWGNMKLTGILHLWKNRALIRAANDKSFGTIKRLIAMGAVPADEAMWKLLAPKKVCDMDTMATVMLLIQRGSKLSSEPTHVVIFGNHMGQTLLQYFLEKNAIKDSILFPLAMKMLLLKEPVYTFSIAAILYYLNNHDSITTRTKNELLFKAIKSGNMSIVGLLLNIGANIECENEARQTPLLYAKVHKMYEIEAFILARGANVGVIDKNGNSYVPHFNRQ